MSKMDALRAMREARYKEQAKRAAGASSPARRPAAPAKRATAAKAPVAPAPVGVEAAEELCGHRSINGRTCTRERGHTAKNHRYS